MTRLWRIELLGGLRVWSPGLHAQSAPITQFRTRKAALLLSYLALHHHREHGREELIELFWPDLELAAARNNLSYTLSALRRQWEGSSTESGLPLLPLLIADRHSLRLNSSAVAGTDVARFERLLGDRPHLSNQEMRRSQLTEAIALYRGPFLPGVYDDWVVAEQERLSSRYGDALVELAGLYAHQDAWALVRDTAVRALTAFPERAEALRLLTQADEKLLACHRNTARTETVVLTLPCPPPKEEVALPPVGLPPSNLPLALTRLFGRETEIAQVTALFQTEDGRRIVTITGPGGVGKTRLSLAVAERLQAAGRMHLFWGPLADIADPAQILPTLAARLGASQNDSQDAAHVALVQTLSSCVGNGETPLLVLDNAEHLLIQDASTAADTSATFLGLLHTLLIHIPTLCVLISSRRALGIAGEQEFPLLPLAVPRKTEYDATASPSIALFVDRARAVRPDFALTRQNAAAICDICCLLDGLPLALEMASGWVRTFSASQIRDRLHQQQDTVLVNRRRDMPARQASVHAVLEWSFRLLHPEEQAFLLCLSAFRGSWDAVAAESICPPELAANAANLLQSLLEHSLVTIAPAASSLPDDDDSPPPRFRLLEVVRAFAAEKLSQSPVWHTGTVLRRHAAYFGTIAAACESHSASADHVVYQNRVETDLDNMRAALDWFERAALSHPEDAENHLRLCANLFTYYQPRGLYSEGYTRLQNALSRPDPPRRSETYAWAQLRAAHLAGYLGDSTRANMLLSEAQKIAGELQNSSLLGNVLYLQSGFLSYNGNFDESLAKCEACLVEFQKAKDDPGIAKALTSLTDSYLDSKDYKRAINRAREAITHYRRIGWRDRIGFSLALLGQAYLGDNQRDQARMTLSEAATTLRLSSSKFDLATAALPHLARLAREDGDYATARRLSQEALSLSHELEHELAIEYQLRGLAQTTSAAGDHEAALRLVGSIQVLREMSSFPQAPFDPVECDIIYCAGEKAIGKATAQMLCGEGRGMTRVEATAYALTL